jgi:N-acetyl-anhydromuramyl-L-alanine amidase AmpD
MYQPFIDYSFFGDLDEFTSDRRYSIDTIIMHSTARTNPVLAVQAYRDHRVSAHYVISADRIYAVVSPDRAAWHAGGGRLADGVDSINQRSIGIELLVAGSRGTVYGTEQIDLTCALLSYLKGEFVISTLASHQAVDRRRLRPRPMGDPPRSDPWNFTHWDRLCAALAPLDISLDI